MSYMKQAVQTALEVAALHGIDTDNDATMFALADAVLAGMQSAYSNLLEGNANAV